MSTVAKFIPVHDLSSEWKRIELLARCLLLSREHKEPDIKVVSELREMQHYIEINRKNSGYWGCLTVAGLSGLSEDIIACVYAPYFNPDVALLYRELTQGSQINPDLAFIHKLLALDVEQFSSLQHACSQQSDLIRQGIVATEGTGPLLIVRPEEQKIALLSGIPESQPDIPGAIHIEMKATWDQLILPTPQKTMLQEFLDWINYSGKVIDEWGAQPVGGPVALFSGSSGTGKTYTASVIADTLGWSLYRVDLASLVSKYIGETEKNINAVFSAAENRNVILQFDEVDALMGKRGEVKDARDRYANMEVSHLLSRIEQHRGPCILTTNLSKHIDSAFTRRFHFVISFPKPEVKQRIELWKLLIPNAAPLSADIDYEMIADSVAMSGGEIRNAAMHAAVLAASQSREITMRDISIGVWRVLQKADGQTRVKQLRHLTAYLPESIYVSSCDE